MWGRATRQEQAGSSLIEVAIAILLISGTVLALGGAMLTVSRGTTTNERVQQIDSALVAYGEMLQTQIPYEKCAGNVADKYQVATLPLMTGHNPATTAPDARWVYPAGMLVEVTGVEAWNPATQKFEERGAALNRCLPDDAGVQRVSYKVGCCGTSTVWRHAQVTKRKAGPS